MRQRRRIAAHGVCRDDRGRILLVRGATPDGRGFWSLPGGRLEHGESPHDAVVREFTEETGLAAEVVALRDVVAEVLVHPNGGEIVHNDRILYEVKVTGAALRHETGGTTDRAAWLEDRELTGLPLLPFTARVLGLPADDAAIPASEAVPTGKITRVQRFGSYGLATDRAGRLLLTRIAAGYPGAGTWHLPGGGTDFGEQPTAGLLRELVEETGQRGRVTALLEVLDRRVPRAVGPEGYPIDWHTVRAVYRVAVDTPTPLSVVEPLGGSTAEARWVDPGELGKLPLNGFAKGTIARHLG